MIKKYYKKIIKIRYTYLHFLLYHINNVKIII